MRFHRQLTAFAAAASVTLIAAGAMLGLVGPPGHLRVAPARYVLVEAGRGARLLAPTPPAFTRDGRAAKGSTGAANRPASLLARPRVRAAFSRWLAHYWLQQWYDGLHRQWLAAHPPPAPISAHRCPAGPIKWEIDSVFGPAAPAFEAFAWRESNCTADPPHNNPSRGTLQLQGHLDLVARVCPHTDPELAVVDYACNIAAAKLLYDDQGTRPWRL